MADILDTFLAQFTELVSGRAKGVDRMGETWALKNNILIKEFPADWDKWGMSAGYRRNKEMANYADEAIVIMPKSGDTKGSTHMINIMNEIGKPVHVFRV